MLSVTLRQLEYVVAIRDHAGVSSAAEALHVSQPALSVALKQIETHLGKALFLRRPGEKMVATSFGRGFLPHACALIADARRLMIVDEAPAGPVGLGVFEDLAPFFLAPLLAASGRVSPPVDIRYHIGGFEEISPAALASDAVDMAITYDLGFDDAYVRHELWRLPLQVVVAADDPFAMSDVATMADVAKRPIILTDEGLSRAHMLRVFSRQDLQLSVAYTAGTMETMRSFAANGLGVGLSYTRPKTNMSYDGKPLRHVTIADSEAFEPIVLVHHRGNSLSPSAEALIQTILGLKISI